MNADPWRLGSLFTGYGGLDEGVRQVIPDVELAWYSEIEPAAVTILGHHYPGVPNLGDITRVDWSQVEPVDILDGGFPCQDVSAAGRGAGLRPGTRSGLWARFAEAIAALRPRLVVIENVRGLLSAEADSALEPCPWCVGDGPGSGLRALGAVLGDLADLGFDAEWRVVPASDEGAPHRRERVFVVAVPADTASVGRGERRPEPARQFGGSDAALSSDATTADTAGAERRGPQQPGLVPPGRGAAEPGERSSATAWGDYEPAIRRWEHILGRPAPGPTVLGARGGRQLSTRFVEWLMGLPSGWVTDVPGLSRNQMLKALGNGVVPQQCAAAVRLLLPLLDTAFTADPVPSLAGAW